MYFTSTPILIMKKIFLFLCIIVSTLNANSQNLTSSNLPILIINTKGQTILDEPKIQAEMKIINNGAGKENLINGTPTDYNGLIGIELRGSSSQMWPKKPYGFELQDVKGNSVDASIFGFPKESDFTLFASYNERSLMHSVLSFKLAREIFSYASRIQYVELILNDTYQGVYVVMEKVKRGSGRVNIAKLTDKDIAGDALTGGYIIKIDKQTGNNEGGWTSKISNNSSGNKSYYQYHYPKAITSEQRNYIHAYVDSVEASIQSANFADKQNGYRKYINTSSYAKMMVLNEVTKNVDAYRISSFFYKEKDSKGGKLFCGPPWDYDFTFGMPDYCDAWTVTDFVYKNFNTVCSTDYWQVPFFWTKLMQDKAFSEEVRTEYTYQRIKGTLQTDKIRAKVDSMKTELKDAQARNFMKWQVLGKYDWPTKTYPSTWEGEVAEIMPWIEGRLRWIDSQWLDPNLIGITTATENVEKDLNLIVYPNPFVERITAEMYSPIAQNAKLAIYNAQGIELYHKDIRLEIGLNYTELCPENYQNTSQISYFKLETAEKSIVKKIVKN